MAADGSVVIEIDGDDKGLKKALDGVGSIASSAAKAAVAAIAGIGTALAGAAAHAVKVGSEFEAAMSNVAAISGAAGDDLQALTDKAKEMGATTSFSASQSAEALTYMAMAGWKTEDMLSGIEGIMNLAAASGESLGTTADIVTDALTAFGMTAADSGRFADVLAAASSNANTNVAMLGDSFKYAAPLAGAMNYSVEDMAVALGLMANSGIKASQAGTSFRAAISAMVKPSEKSAEAMEALGLYANRTVLALENSDGTAKSLSETMEVLRSAFAGLSETEQTYYAAQIFGTEAMSGMLAIINASEEDYKKLTTAIGGASGAAKEMADIQLDNLAGQITILQSAIEGFEIEFFQSLGNPITEAVRGASKAVSELTMTFQNEGLGAAIEKLGGMAASALTSLASAAPSFIETAANLIQSLLTGIQENAPQLAEAALSIGGSLISGVVSVIPSLTATAIQLVGSTASAIVENLPTIAETGTQMLGQLVSGIIEGLPQLAKGAVTLMTSLGQYLQENLPTLLQSGLEAIVQLTASIRENAGLIVDGAISLALSLAQGLVDSIPAMIENIPTIVSNIANCINDNAPKLLGAALQLIVTLGKGLIEAIPTLLTNIPQIIGAIVDVWAAFNWLNLGKNAITGIKNGITNMLSAVKQAGKSVLDAIVNAISNLPQTLLNIGRNGITGLANAISGLLGTVTSAMGSIVSGIINSITSLPSQMLQIGRNIVDGIANGIRNGAAAAINAVADLAGNLVNKAKSFLGIASPSKVMAKEVGPFIPQGIETGVENEIPRVQRSIAEQVAGLTSKVRSAVEGEAMKVSVGLTAGSGEIRGKTETPPSSGPGVTLNVYVNAGETTSPAQARNVGRELGEEAARELRRRGLVPA